MPVEPIAYRKLPGSGASGMEYHRLYQGPDHLLLVSSTGFTEMYRRFYFRDIQAIIVRKTSMGGILNGLLGLCVVFCLIGLVSGMPGLTTAWLLGWALPAALFGMFLLFNLVRGPTCVCDLRTAVQTRRIGCIGRLRAARQLLQRLHPLIDAAQGAMDPEVLRQRIDQARAEHAAAPPVMGGRTW